MIPKEVLINSESTYQACKIINLRCTSLLWETVNICVSKIHVFLPTYANLGCIHNSIRARRAYISKHITKMPPPQILGILSINYRLGCISYVPMPWKGFEETNNININIDIQIHIHIHIHIVSHLISRAILQCDERSISRQICAFSTYIYIYIYSLSLLVLLDLQHPHGHRPKNPMIYLVFYSPILSLSL